MAKARAAVDDTVLSRELDRAARQADEAAEEGTTEVQVIDQAKNLLGDLRSQAAEALLGIAIRKRIRRRWHDAAVDSRQGWLFERDDPYRDVFHSRSFVTVGSKRRLAASLTPQQVIDDGQRRLRTKRNLSKEQQRRAEAQIRAGEEAKRQGCKIMADLERSKKPPKPS